MQCQTASDNLSLSYRLENMPGPRQPCPYPRCNGALVAPCTLQRHASHVLPASIPSFSAWSQHLAGATIWHPSQNSLGSDADGVDHTPSSSQDNIKYSQPLKRLQSSTVHLSSLFSIPSLRHICILSSPPMYALYLCIENNTHIIYLSGCLSIWA